MEKRTTGKRIIQCLCVGSIETNCWVYFVEGSRASPRPCTVIDPGAEAPLIIEHLRKNQLYPEYILMTHGHFDHITALPGLIREFPAITAIHRDDASYLKTGELTLLSDNDLIGQFRVLHVPGHTRGGAAFYDEEGDILFTGDTLFCADCGRTDLEGGNQEALEKSLKRLLAMKGTIRVFPGHGPETTIAQEADRGLSFFTG